jgi:hypothetical protein
MRYLNRFIQRYSIRDDVLLRRARYNSYTSFVIATNNNNNQQFCNIQLVNSMRKPNIRMIKTRMFTSTNNSNESFTSTTTSNNEGGSDNKNQNERNDDNKDNAQSMDDVPQPDIKYYDDERDIHFDHSDYNDFYSLIDFTEDDPNIPYFEPPSNNENESHDNKTKSFREQIDEGVQRGYEYRMAQRDVMNLNCRTCPICSCVFVGGRYYMLHHLLHEYECLKELPLNTLQQIIKQKEDMDGVQYDDIVLEEKEPKPKKKKVKKKKPNPVKLKKRRKEFLKWQEEREKQANKENPE